MIGRLRTCEKRDILSTPLGRALLLIAGPVRRPFGTVIDQISPYVVIVEDDTTHP